MKRHLTPDEIRDVLSDMRPVRGVDDAVYTQIHRSMMDAFTADLKTKVIYPEMLGALKAHLTRQYYATQAPPGDSVGIYTAQSIGERQTQLALDSFHSTGITTSTVVTGVPRFNELVNATKNPKSVVTTIYPSQKYDTIQAIRAHGLFIKHVQLKDLVRTLEIHSKTRELAKWYGIFKHMEPDIIETIRTCTHYVRCTCDLQQLYMNRIPLDEIAAKLSDAFDGIVCAWSPLHLGVIDVWFDAQQLSLSSAKPYITHNNKHIIFAEEVLMPQLVGFTVRGVTGIDQIHYIQKNNEWVIEAQGFNMAELLSLDMVDQTRTISNHMWEIYHTLGLEATREFLIAEFTAVISVDSYINARHIQLLVDVMLYTGTIASISRYGVHKNQSGALTKCSFEESLDQILTAGTYGENELINGVSGAIICGKVSQIGTGLCDLVYKV